MELSIENGLWWSAPLRLPSWAGYQSRHGAYGAIDSDTPSDGRAKLVFAPEGRRTDPLTAAELNLISWFEQNEPAVSEAVKMVIFDWCSPNSSDRLGEFDFDNSFPLVRDLGQLKSLVGLHTVYIHQIDGGGTPYIGYEFGCQWEVEHGLGVLMHGARPVHVGFADTSFLLWMAKKDWEKQSAEP